ncbi:hydrolase [Metabacillus sediminilitoris]|uniref:Hydrolase n=2 Tax=Metabacillus sediminilitoris TaxID=2567941 RepID=A0A4S4BXA9_9BACI|nr:isochorismatase family protein [Metabacillus sediminilitoris]THF79836.1 hydrolase [Metabacillus sediminilitoris]
MPSHQSYPKYPHHHDKVKSKNTEQKNTLKQLLDPHDAALLLIDNQSGLFQLVNDLTVTELRRNVVALAKMAKLVDMPTITTASTPEGQNGPLIPEIFSILPDSTYISRKDINAWDNPIFVDAVKKTGKNTLIIAGTLSSVCLAFPAISALAEGYKVYVVMDASGSESKMSFDTSLARLIQAGAIPMSTFAMISEVQKTWNRPDADQFIEIYAEILPEYKLLIESYEKARAVGKKESE